MLIRLISILLFLPTLALGGYNSNPYSAGSAVYKVSINLPNSQRIGTGVLIARDKILTNCHVVKPPGFPQVIHRNSKQVFRVASYYNLGSFDACVLTGNFTEGEPVGFSNKVDIGQIVWHYGYPRGIEGVGQGVVTNVIQNNGSWIIQSTSFCNPGSSGGPLLDVKGNLVGLNYGVFNNHPDACLSIPAFLLQPLIRF